LPAAPAPAAQWDLILPMPDASGNTNLPQQAYQHAAFV